MASTRQKVTRAVVGAGVLLAAIVVLRGRSPGAPGGRLQVERLQPLFGEETKQLIVVHAAEMVDTAATLETFERSGGGWRTVNGPMLARLGRSGMSDHHLEGDGSTPTGVYTMREAFGIKSLTDTRLPYRVVGQDDWWVSDSSQPDIYNTWQTTTPAEGGNPTRWRADHAEHLITKGRAYNHAVVIDYNRPPTVTSPKPGAGSGIFLHVDTGKPTQGCVAIDENALVSIMKWLDPTKNPRIVIGTDTFLLEAVPPPDVVGTAPGGFEPVTPARLLDTREPLGPQNPIGHGALGPDESLALQVNDVAGIPHDATAVAVNLTITGQTADTHLTIYPDDADARPATSNVNASVGEDRANLVIVRTGVDGKVRIYNKNGSAHVVVDVVGYVSPTATGGVSPVTPYRVIDTREGTTGRARGPVAENTSVNIPIPFVPSGATAAIVNVTAVDPNRQTWMAAFAGGAPWSSTSTVNTLSGETSANLAIVPLSRDNTIQVLNRWGNAHLVVDVAGFLLNGTSRYEPAQVPVRVMDTREGLGLRGKVGAGDPVRVTIPGLPKDATAVAITLTATESSADTYLRASQPNTPVTEVSNLNLTAHSTRANLAIVPVDSTGNIVVYNKNGSLHLIVDVSGWIVSCRPRPAPCR